VSPWLGATSVVPPVVSVRRDQDRPNKIVVTLAREKGAPTYQFTIWTLSSGEWKLAILYAGDDSVDVNLNEWSYDELAGLPEAIVVSAVDRVGTESRRVRLNQEQIKSAKVVTWAK
jgi:hypothetical protein